jgi:hypothetical protein
LELQAVARQGSAKPWLFGAGLNHDLEQSPAGAHFS